MPLPGCAHCGAQLSPDEPVAMRRGPWGEREFLHDGCRDAPDRQASAEFRAAYDELLASLRPGADWDPRLDVTSARSGVLVSATDVANAGPHGCLRQLAFKTRPAVKLRSWRRSFQSGGSAFPLGEILDLVVAAHEEPACATYAGQKAWLERRLVAGGAHRLTLPYVRHAVEAVLDAHDSIEADVGPLRLLTRDPAVGAPDRQLTVWGPLYAAPPGGGGGKIREVRRLRLGAAHKALDDADRRWAAAAAMVAALSPGTEEPARIRVVEVGAVDGSVVVAFDGDLAAVREQYRSLVTPALADLLEGQAATPGWSCASCKVTGGCDALLQLPGALGRDGSGVSTRSLSATGLDTHNRCPGRFLLQSTLHLPSETRDTGAQARGRAVHRWLQMAHDSGDACVVGVVPQQRPDDDEADALTDGDLQAAAAYVRQHVALCPFGAPDTHLVAAEALIHGWDEPADTVLSSKPDLIYRVGDQLVLRETKSSNRLPRDASHALQTYLQVAFLLVQLASGLGPALNGASVAGGGRVELEVLTPDAAQLYTWDAGDPVDLAAARERLADAVLAWHQDGRFDTKPGEQCVACPVRRWCPDSELAADGALLPGASGVASTDSGEGSTSDAYDLPPF